MDQICSLSLLCIAPVTLSLTYIHAHLHTHLYAQRVDAGNPTTQHINAIHPPCPVGFSDLCFLLFSLLITLTLSIPVARRHYTKIISVIDYRMNGGCVVDFLLPLESRGDEWLATPNA